MGEDFDRGFYAGPFGYFSKEGGEVCVAIRTARVDGRTVEVYAGAGVVEGSTWEGEWAETEDKMRAIVGALEARGKVSSPPPPSPAANCDVPTLFSLTL